jgi:hypothetical protein
MTRHNIAAPVDAPMAPVFHIARSGRRATEQRRYRDMKLHSILLGWIYPDQALRVAAGIPGKRAFDGLPRNHSGLLSGVRSLPDNVSNLEASIRGRTRIGRHG